MSARAYVEADWLRDGVAIGLMPQEGQVITGWQTLAIRQLEPDVTTSDDDLLRIPETLARALYEALAEHFGHSGHDTRALRKDYDAERARVDLLIRSWVER